MEYFSFVSSKEIDWLELNLLKTGRPMSKSLIQQLGEDAEEQEVDSWISELEERNLLFDIPLYEVKRNKVIPLFNYTEKPEYFLCVYFAYNGAYNNHIGTSLFERISGKTLENFIGGKSYVLGFPNALNFNHSLDKIADLCFEGRMIQADGDYKDDGVDVVGFKSFGDNKGANLYILLQCAAGQHWAKKKKINLGRWTNYIMWYTENLISSMSTTSYVSNHEWRKRYSDFGMLLDRTRIYNWYYKNSSDAQLQGEVLTWCKTTLGE